MKTLKLRFFRTKGDWVRQRYEQVVFKVKDSGNASTPSTGETWTWFSLLKSKYTRLLTTNGSIDNICLYGYWIQPESIDVTPDGSIREFLCSKVVNGKPTYSLYDYQDHWYKLAVVGWNADWRKDHGRVSTIRI
jgi:hypothetical protein